MGYSIYYDRAFIRVGDKYIPVVQSGSSNSADNVNGRWVAEKKWDVLNWGRRDRVLFSESEIHEIAKDYEQGHQENGMSFKSRNKPFATGEFEQWIVGGMKHACSIEDYSAFGNNPIVVDFPDGRINRWRTQPVNSSEELLSIISGFNDGREFDISFSNREVIHPTARRKQARLNPLGEKPSVLERIAESRAQAAAEEKPKQGKHSKSREAEL